MPHTTPHATTLILIGLRASGKSTIAKLLAAKLNRPAIDLDDLTPSLLHEQTAADALRNHGQPAFRQAELAALRNTLTNHPGAILALGGGTPTAPGARELLESAQREGRAKIIYPRASEQTLRARLVPPLPRSSGGGAGGSATAEGPAHSTNPPEHTRPTLTGQGTLEEISPLPTLRDPLYTTLASIVIDVNNLTAREATEAITTQLA